MNQLTKDTSVSIVYYDKDNKKLSQRSHIDVIIFLRKVRDMIALMVKTNATENLYISKLSSIDITHSDSNIIMKIHSYKCIITIDSIVNVDYVKERLEVYFNGDSSTIDEIQYVNNENAGTNNRISYDAASIDTGIFEVIAKALAKSDETQVTDSNNDIMYKGCSSPQSRAVLKQKRFTEDDATVEVSLLASPPSKSNEIKAKFGLALRRSPLKVMPTLNTPPSKKSCAKDTPSPGKLKCSLSAKPITTTATSNKMYFPKDKLVSNGKQQISPTTTLSLNRYQVLALEGCKNGLSVFITGSAGSGKSHLVGSIVKCLIEKHGKSSVYVTATTGLAACAINGTTIHQFAGISTYNHKDSIQDIVTHVLSKQHVLKRWKQAKVLIIDEISMLHPELFDIINSIAKRARDCSSPMGGLQTILVGDFFQLPPIVSSSSSCSRNTGNTNRSNITSNYVATQSHDLQSRSMQYTQQHIQQYTTTTTQTNSSATTTNAINTSSNSNSNDNRKRYCFESNAWSEVVKESFILQTVFRQTNDSFINLLNQLRVGNCTVEVLQTLNAKCVGKELNISDGILPSKIFTHKKDVDNTNQRELSALSGECYAFTAKDTPNSEMFVKLLNSNCPAKERLQLKIGMLLNSSLMLFYFISTTVPLILLVLL